jgi:hypothetical protein
MKSIPNHVDAEAFFFCRFAGLIWNVASRHGLDRSCTIDLAETFSKLRSSLLPLKTSQRKSTGQMRFDWTCR